MKTIKSGQCSLFLRRRPCRTAVVLLAMVFVSTPTDGSQKQDATSQETVVQSGVTGGQIAMMAFSPSGEYLAVACALSSEVTVWHLPSRTMMHRFQSNRGVVGLPQRLEFVAGPKRVCLQSSLAVELWDITREDYRRYTIVQPTLLNTTSGTPEGSFTAYALSQSGVIEAYGQTKGGKHRIRIQNRSTETSVEFVSRIPIRGISVGPLDDRIAVISAKEIVLYNFDGDEIDSWQNEDSDSLSYGTVTFSSDGAMATILACKNGFKVAGFGQGRVSIFRDCETGKIVHSFDHNGLNHHVAMTPDGKSVIQSRPKQVVTELRRLDLQSGNSVPWLSSSDDLMALEIHNHTGIVAAAVSRYADRADTVQLFEIDSGIMIAELEAHTAKMGVMMFDPVADRLLQFGDGVFEWDLKRGERNLLRTAIGGEPLQAANGKVAFLRGENIDIFSTDPKNRKPEASIKVHRPNILAAPSPLYLSKDLKRAVIASGSQCQIVDLLTGKVTQVIDRKSSPLSTKILVISLSDDGNDVALVDQSGNLEIWSVATATCDFRMTDKNFMSRLNGRFSSISSIVPDRLGFLLSGELGCLSLEKGWDLKVLKPASTGHVITTSADGRRFISYDWTQSKIEVTNRTTLETISSLPYQLSSIWKTSFTKDDNELLIQRYQGDIEVWKLDSKTMAGRLVALPGNGGLIITDDGFYKTNQPNVRSVAFRRGRKMLLPDQLTEQRNRPDIVLQRLGHAENQFLSMQKRIADWRLVRRRIIADLEFGEAPKISFASSVPIQTADQLLSLKLKLHDIDKSAESKVMVWINGVPIKQVRQTVNNQGLVECEVSLLPGDNRITIQTQDKAGRVSEKLSHITYCRASPLAGTLWFVGIGVSEYQDTQNNLSLAAKDAIDLSQVLGEVTPRPFKSLVLTNEEAQKPRVLADVQNFLSTAERQDTVVLFVAGHGFLQTETYNFALHECSFSDDATGCLSLSELEDLVDSCAARQRVLLLDTCHAGEVLPAIANQAEDSPRITSRGSLTFKQPVDSSDGSMEFRRQLLDQFARDSGQSGISVIAASDGGQLALESARWQNGAFTFAVREAFQAKAADLDGDAVIRLSELATFVEKRVADVTGNSQTPQTRFLNSDQDATLVTGHRWKELPQSIKLSRRAEVPSHLVLSDNPGMLAVRYGASVYVKDLTSGRQLEIATDESVSGVAFVNAAKSLIIREGSTKLKLVDVATGQSQLLAQQPGFILMPLISSDRKLALLQSFPDSGDITFWDFTSEISTTTHSLGERFRSTAMCFPEPEDRVRTYMSGVISDVSLRTGKVLQQTALHDIESDLDKFGSSPLFSASGKYLILDRSDETTAPGASVWSVSTSKKIASFDQINVSVVNTNDGVVVLKSLNGEAMGGMQGDHTIVNLSTRQAESRAITVHRGETAVMSADQNYLAVAPDTSFFSDQVLNRGVRIYRLTDGKEIAWIAKPFNDFFKLCFTKDNRTLVGVDGNGKIFQYRLDAVANTNSESSP